MDVWANPWVIGVGAGILNGIIVFLITIKIFPNILKRDYMNKLTQANHEVVLALCATVSEHCLPANDIITSLISATSTKYKVKREDMLSINTIIDVLIKEVMDTSFISSELKEQYCRMLSEKKETYVRNHVPENGDVFMQKSRLPLRYSLLFAAMTAVFITVFLLIQSQGILSEYQNIFPICMGTLGMFLVTVIPLLIYRQFQTSKKKTKYDKETLDVMEVVKERN